MSFKTRFARSLAAALLGGAAEAGAACLASSAKWQNAPIPPQSAPFTAVFDAEPASARMDGVTGLAQGAVSSFAGMAAIVRFNSAGYIDARNGGAYGATNAVPYFAGAAYHFRLTVNPAARSYSVYVTPPGAAEIALATNFAFRAEQAAATSLNDWSLYARSGSHQVCGFAVTAGEAPPPDVIPPAVAMLSPASGATVSGTAALSAAASDNVGVAGVQFLLDGAPLGPELANPPYTAAWNTTLASNSPHSLAAAARDAAGNRTTSAAATVIVDNAAPPPPGCLTSNLSWQNTQFPARAAAFAASFDAVPAGPRIDGVTGLSNGSATGFSSMAVSVRFNTSGLIDARKGGAYAADASIPYAAGGRYHFRLAVDPAAHVYSVWVTPPGGAETVLASSYGFRTEQASVSSLDGWTLYADQGGHQVCDFALSAPAP